MAIGEVYAIDRGLMDQFPIRPMLPHAPVCRAKESIHARHGVVHHGIEAGPVMREKRLIEGKAQRFARSSGDLLSDPQHHGGNSGKALAA